MSEDCHSEKPMRFTRLSNRNLRAKVDMNFCFFLIFLPHRFCKNVHKEGEPQAWNYLIGLVHGVEQPQIGLE